MVKFSATDEAKQNEMFYNSFSVGALLDILGILK
jgi:hypothetical protein